MLFIGIATMQEGMSRFEGIVTPADFPDDSLGGRLLLVLIGVAITLVTQSSSVGVATALAALGSGCNLFPPGRSNGDRPWTSAPLSKAALATVGGSTATRRTGFAHVIYNLMTGVLAFCLLDLYALLTERWLAGGGVEAAQFALVGLPHCLQPSGRGLRASLCGAVRPPHHILVSRSGAGAHTPPQTTACSTIRRLAVYAATSTCQRYRRARDRRRS